MQMGTPREELSPQQSSAQVVDSNIGNQQHSHLVSHSYFKGGGGGGNSLSTDKCQTWLLYCMMPII